ncbi:MAG: hypothetical protein ACREDR_24780 [Blastocatellia bacterium]
MTKLISKLFSILIRRRRTSGQRVSRMTPEAGLSIVEFLIGGLLLSMAMIFAAQHLAAQVAMISLNARQRLADGEALAALSKAAAQKQADYDGSFTLNSNGTATLGTLQTGYYDYVVSPDPMSSTTPTLPPQCGSWPCAVDPSAIPSGATVYLVRAWNIQTTDAARGDHQISSAVFPQAVLNPGADRSALTWRNSSLSYH